MADELRLSIEKLVYGGDGLAHADGNTVFVPYVLPGEEVRATAKSKKKKLIWAQLVEVTSASEQRGKAQCPHFQTCGGCHYQHIPAAEQVRLKKGILKETLSRLGGISWDGLVQEHTAEPYGYRNRAQWAVRGGMPRAIGYFLPESSTIVPIDECPVLSPALARTFGQLQDMARSGTLPAGVLEIEAFADSSDKKIALNVAFDRFSKLPGELAAAFRAAVPEIESLLLLDRKKNKFELTGVGFFTLPVARAFSRVISVDANLAATRDLRANAENAGLQVTSHNEHAKEFLGKLNEKPDLVVLDPPRAGLGAAVAAELARLGAPDIAYLSCDPATLARDLAVLLGAQKKGNGTVGLDARYEIAEMHI